MRTNRAFGRMRLLDDADQWIDPRLADLTTGTRAGGTTRLRQESVGGTRLLVATAVPVGDRGDSLVLTVQDVTEIHREEEEGGRRQRLEALGRMAAELAHEVRNPLGGIRLFAGLLHDDLANAPAQREMTDQILAASAALETTVTNLLAFAAPPRAARRRRGRSRRRSRRSSSWHGPSSAHRDRSTLIWCQRRLTPIRESVNRSHGATGAGPCQSAAALSCMTCCATSSPRPSSASPLDVSGRGTGTSGAGSRSRT